MKTTAKVIADTINPNTVDRVISVECVYPRYIHPEHLRHSFAFSVASSRATPVIKTLDQVREDPVVPIITMNKAGMVGITADEDVAEEAFTTIRELASVTADYVEKLHRLNIHKQNANRYLEPFLPVKVLITGHSKIYDHFFDLRISPDAQPEMKVLAEEIRDAIDSSYPVQDEYHIPYITKDEIETNLSTQDIFMISAARCARVSYSLFNETGLSPLDKDIKLAKMLIEKDHVSPFEHQLIRWDNQNELRYGLKGWRSYRDVYLEGVPGQ